MRQPTSATYPISDFREWHHADQLVIAPKFQRRSVWVPKAKSYLVDTILRGMPIPPLFLRLVVDPTRQRAVREVVDGQQRLRAILEFLNDEFPILKVHNEDLAGSFFSQLPETEQLRFLGYKFVCHILEDVSDADVLDIFARINTYTVRLNAQELRNSEFFGAFKRTVYEIAFRHYAFWRNNRILTDQDIARMREAELVSELLVTMIRGIGETRDRDLREYYERFDDSFPGSKKTERQFDETINILGDLFPDGMANTQFRRKPLFFSLFVTAFDARWGLPGSSRDRLTFNQSTNKAIRSALEELDRVLRASEPPRRYLAFVEAARRGTADPGKRRLRHDILWREILKRL